MPKSSESKSCTKKSMKTSRSALSSNFLLCSLQTTYACMYGEYQQIYWVASLLWVVGEQGSYYVTVFGKVITFQVEVTLFFVNIYHNWSGISLIFLQKLCNWVLYECLHRCTWHNRGISRKSSTSVILVRAWFVTAAPIESLLRLGNTFESQ